MDRNFALEFVRVTEAAALLHAQGRARLEVHRAAERVGAFVIDEITTATAQPERS